MPSDLAHRIRPLCEHGFVIGEHRGSGGMMMAPYSTCKCCQSIYFYIDTGHYSTDYQETYMADKDLCPGCGGRRRHVIIRNGTTEVDEYTEFA